MKSTRALYTCAPRGKKKHDPGLNSWKKNNSCSCKKNHAQNTSNIYKIVLKNKWLQSQIHPRQSQQLQAAAMLNSSAVTRIKKICDLILNTTHIIHFHELHTSLTSIFLDFRNLYHERLLLQFVKLPKFRTHCFKSRTHLLTLPIFRWSRFAASSWNFSHSFNCLLSGNDIP